MSSHAPQLSVEIPPRLCDAQGMVHAIRYHELLEDAFLAWLTERRLPYDELRRRGTDLVIGTVTIRYRVPARLGDRVDVSCRRDTSSTSTVTVEYAITRGVERLATALITYIAVREGKSTALPSELAEAHAGD